MWLMFARWRFLCFCDRAFGGKAIYSNLSKTGACARYSSARSNQIAVSQLAQRGKEASTNPMTQDRYEPRLVAPPCFGFAMLAVNNPKFGQSETFVRMILIDDLYPLPN
jgi:hypothetical protein